MDIVLLVYKSVDGKYISVSRKHDLSDFGFPGGKIDMMEDPKEAMIRELREETGLEAVNLKLIGTDNNKGYLVGIYTCSALKGSIKTKELGVVRWSTAKEITDGKSFGKWNKQVLLKYGFEKNTKTAKLKSNVKLAPHQKEFVEFLDNHDNVIGNHIVGSGKTLSSIAGFERLKEKNKAKKALVVLPASLKDNFLENGIQQFTNSGGVIIGSKQEASNKNLKNSGVTTDLERLRKGVFDNADYYIVSNELFRKDPNAYLNATKADTIILDEFHKYRDPSSQNYKQLKEIRPKVKHFIGLTGTPIANHPRDIQPLIDITTNGKHGLGSYNEFDKKFIHTKKTYEGPLAWFGYGTLKTEYDIKNKDKLKKEFGKVIHTYQQQDPDTPKKVIKEVSVKMSKEQKKIYDFYMSQMPSAIRSKIENNIPVTNRDAAHIFTKILRARQVSNSLEPFDINKTKIEASYATPKIKSILEDVKRHLNQSPKNKVIIYTSFFNAGVDVITEGLKDRKIPFGMFVGSTFQKKADRAEDVRKYLRGDVRVMVINSAGIEGLNLPGTTKHYTVEPHFNPAVMEQEEARGIRKGSPVEKVDVLRYKAVAPDTLSEQLFGTPLFGKDTTVDEWILNLASNKEKLNAKFMQQM